MTEPLKLAVVGHTNVGKTSLLRTDPRRGLRRGVPPPQHHSPCRRRAAVGGRTVTGALRHARVGGRHRLARLPGAAGAPGRAPGRPLPASSGSCKAAKRASVSSRKPGAAPVAGQRRRHVIDAREPVLAKYRDELEVLASCGKPLLPVLNFVASHQHREAQWREALARLGLHALVRFDSVATRGRRTPPLRKPGPAAGKRPPGLATADRRPAGPTPGSPAQRQAPDCRAAAGLRCLPAQRRCRTGGRSPGHRSAAPGYSSA